MKSELQLSELIIYDTESHHLSPAQECAIDCEAQFLEDIRVGLREMREGKTVDSLESLASLRAELELEADR